MSSTGDIEGALEVEAVVESLEPVATEEQAYGRYLLQYEIASGGMASIYLARARGAAGFERPIAIKRIHPHLARKPAFVDMFLDEARLNARIAHPNVCAVLDFGEADGSYFMAMEYLVGQPLSRVLGAVATRPELATSARWHAMAARILADACQGLHAAHELVDERGNALHVVHRDFTPHNVFVTYDGAVKVFDFGVARSEGRRHQTETGLLKGKLAYMSPEQLSRAPVDRRLDVWAAGVCLWELLTLRRLFGKRSELEIVQAIATETILKPSQVRTGVPAELDAITLRALDRDPDRRTPTARVLAKELNQFVSTTGVSTSLADVAELMAELFAEEREHKLGVVAHVLRSEDALPLDMNESSAVQRSRLGQTSPARPSRAVPTARAPSVAPAARSPASVRPPSVRPPSMRPPPVAAPPSRPPSPLLPAPAPPALHPLAVPEEATAKTPVDLADMLEPPSEISVALQLGAAPSLALGTDSEPPASAESVAATSAEPDAPQPEEAAVPVLPEPENASSRTPILLGIAALAVLGAVVFFVIASGALEGGEPRRDGPPLPRAGIGATQPPPQEGLATSAQGAGPTDEVQPVDDVVVPEPVVAPPDEAIALDQGGDTSDSTAEGEGTGSLVPEGGTASGGETEEVAIDEADSEGASPERRIPTRGSVNVAARGGWAELYVDGQHVGRTPRGFMLSVGRHVIELRREGEGTLARRVVTVRPGRMERILFEL